MQNWEIYQESGTNSCFLQRRREAVTAFRCLCPTALFETKVFRVKFALTPWTRRQHNLAPKRATGRLQLNWMMTISVGNATDWPRQQGLVTNTWYKLSASAVPIRDLRTPARRKLNRRRCRNNQAFQNRLRTVLALSASGVYIEA